MLHTNLLRRLDGLTRSLHSRVADIGRQEKERARTRIVVALVLATAWGADWIAGRAVSTTQWAVATIAISYCVATVWVTASRDLTERMRFAGLLGTLIVDPIVLVLMLVMDPGRFALVYPFVIFVVIRSGIRYGIWSFDVSWVSTLLATPLLLLDEFWRTNLEFTISFALVVALSRGFFAPLIVRIHDLRRIEEERARVNAMHETVVARSTFLAKISHELRSPIQGIVSALDVLDMRRDEPISDNRELINRIRRSSVLLNAQLRDLLTLAKGEAGQLTVHPEAFDAVSLVLAVGDAAADLASAKGISVRIEVPSEPLFVVADGPRIDQILTNLVVNSIRSTHQGEVRIRLEKFEARTLSLEVADTGPGFPATALSTLLSPTTHLREERGAGSGFGLTIVRTLVDLLGGSISLPEAHGRGGRVVLRIPAEPAANERGSEAPVGENGRMLIVDDRDDVCDALAIVANELGFECDTAFSAAVAANLLAARRYDAVLLDIDMPLRSGADIATEASREGLNRSARFVGMSAGDVSDDVRKIFDAWLTKPIGRSALTQALGLGGVEFRSSQPGLWTAGDDRS